MLKITIYIPQSHSLEMKALLGELGCGKLSNYDFWSFSTKGEERYRALDGATPFLGKRSEIQTVESEKLETVCEESLWEEIKEQVFEAHPYEKPAIQAVKLL